MISKQIPTILAEYEVVFKITRAAFITTAAQKTLQTTTLRIQYSEYRKVTGVFTWTTRVANVILSVQII